ncbi:MAG: polymer-forming cytoskeletal protein [Planctomycetota bacterium]
MSDFSPSVSPTVLGPDCRIHGDLVLEGDVLIRGRFDGTLRVTGTLEIADGATVEGTVLAGAVVLAGQATADLVAEGSVDLTGSAVFRGRVFTGRLSVDDGADFEGGIHIGPRALDAAGELLNGKTNDAGSAAVTTNAEAGEGLLQRRRPRGLQNGNGSNQPVANGAHD